MFRAGLRAVVWGLILGAAASLAHAERVSYKDHRVVRVEVRSQGDLDLLYGIATQILNCHVGIMPLDAIIPPDRMAALQASGLTYHVLTEDLEPFATRHLYRAEARGAFDDYLNFDEIVAFINNLAATRPDLCEVFSMGTSLEGREIWVLHVTGPGGGNKPAVLYHSLIHAREWITAPVVLFLAEHLVNDYDTDPEVAALVDNVDIYLAPCVNPDGYVYTWETNRYWRKNRRLNGDGSFGVDLNRNFAFQWGHDNSGSSPSPSQETYRGTGPFSEPETTVLSDFIAGHPAIVAYMDYHNYSQMIMWPWGYECAGGPDEPDAATFSTLGSEMQMEIEVVHGVYYEPGPICETIYPANGSSVDWVYGDQGVFAFTIELRPPPGAGLPGFSPPESEILPTCQENLPALKRLTEWAADYVDTEITLPDGPATILSPGAPTVIDVQIVHVGESMVPDSATLHYRYDAGAFQTAPLTFVSGYVHQATLPPAACGDSPEYYFSVEGDLSGVVYAPSDAPATAFTARVGELQVLFTDDFEADRGWTVGGAVADGQWERGVPIDCNRGDPPSDQEGSGACYLTDNSSSNGCNSDVDDGTTILTSPPFDLSTGGVISYAYWLNDVPAGALGAEDSLQVEISTNAAGTNWTLVRRYDTAMPAWRNDSIEVGLEVPASSSMRIRFLAGDLSPGDVVECGLDAFEVQVLSCGVPTCVIGGDTFAQGAVNPANECEFCDPATDPGAWTPRPAGWACPDGAFCNGAETCDGSGSCQPGGFPCAADEWCNEAGASCMMHGDGDFNGDLRVALDDFAAFQECFDQPGVGPCAAGNMTGEDENIDLADFSEFLTVLGGPN